MPMMKKKEAEQSILHAWDVWAANPANASSLNDGMAFFTHLQRQRPDLLDFKYSGDKWQAVHGFLIHGRRVTE
jgi:hypothetical protein